MKGIFMLLAAAIVCSTATAQHISVPKAVKATFSKEHSDAQKVKWTKEGEMYEASFNSNGKAMSIVYDLNGNVSETEIAIPVDQLPAKAKQFAKAKGKINNAAKIIKADGSILYEAEVKGVDLIFDKNGVFVKENREH